MLLHALCCLLAIACVYLWPRTGPGQSFPRLSFSRPWDWQKFGPRINKLILEKKSEGRTGAPRKTTAADDKLIVDIVEKLREKEYVDASIVHRRLPRRLQVGSTAITTETVRLRIQAVDLHWEEKAVKSEVSPEVEQKRFTSCYKNEKGTSVKWLEMVQPVGDF